LQFLLIFVDIKKYCRYFSVLKTGKSSQKSRYFYQKIDKVTGFAKRISNNLENSQKGRQQIINYLAPYII